MPWLAQPSLLTVRSPSQHATGLHAILHARGAGVVQQESDLSLSGWLCVTMMLLQGANIKQTLILHCGACLGTTCCVYNVTVLKMARCTVQLPGVYRNPAKHTVTEALPPKYAPVMHQALLQQPLPAETVLKSRVCLAGTATEHHRKHALALLQACATSVLCLRAPEDSTLPGRV